MRFMKLCYFYRMKKIFLYLAILFFALTLNVDAKSVKIVQLTDVHIGDCAEGKTCNAMQNLNTAIVDINKRKDIDLVIFTGDNIDKSNLEILKKFLLATKNKIIIHIVNEE